MRKGILKSFLSSGLQAISVQVLGVLFIAIVAKFLSKEAFGIVQAANAMAMFITTLLSFGLEQVVVRRIAASSTSDWAAAAFLFHNLVGSVIALGLTVLAAQILPDPESIMYYLPLFFAAQAVMFLVTPLKQFLNAKHIFTPYGVIAIFSNTLKIVLALVLYSRNGLSIMAAGYILLGCAFLEIFTLLIYIRTKTSFRFTFRLSAYRKLIRESMPQYLSAVFDSSLSRLDIILLGFIGASFAATADYGIAYRAYEMARLPIVIIAPVILNIFARAMASGGKISIEVQAEVKTLYTIEIFFAMLIPLVLNILWSPVLNIVFDNKYGSSNAPEFLILSVCIPLHFFINLMWTICFSARKYKKTATITMFSALINLVLNIVLIKYWGGLGAAIAYLLTTLFQAAAYYLVVNRHMMHIPLDVLFRFLAAAALSYIGVQWLNLNTVLEIVIAVTLYFAINLATGWINRAHFKNIRTYLQK